MASLPCLMVLERTRPSLIFAALVLRKPTIMSNAEWKHDPWCLHPERVDWLKLLFDILADCPRLFVVRDQLPSYVNEETRNAVAQNLSLDCDRIVAGLDDWAERFTSDPSHTPDEIAAPRTTPLIEDECGALHPAWSTVFHYQSFYHANAMTIYNGAIILALRFSDSIDVGSRSSYENQMRQERISVAALSICRSVNYHQQDMWGEQGVFALLFPLRMAYDGLGEKETVVRAWLQSVMQDISVGKWGLWRSAKNLLEIGK